MFFAGKLYFLFHFISMNFSICYKYVISLQCKFENEEKKSGNNNWQRNNQRVLFVFVHCSSLKNFFQFAQNEQYFQQTLSEKKILWESYWQLLAKYQRIIICFCPLSILKLVKTCLVFTPKKVWHQDKFK